jgi:hypothetical protein
MRIDAGSFDDFADLINEIGLPELPDADIDGELQVAGERGAFPFLELLAGAF